MGDATTLIAVDVGIPAALGFVVGYTIKKIVKAALVLLGSFLLILFYLEERGVITINVERMGSLVQNLTQRGYVQVEALMDFLISSALPSGSFLIGLILGLKKG